jgi:hypothetical protein
MHIVRIDHGAKQITQLGIRLEGQGVLTLRPIQGDGGHPGLHIKQKMRGLIARQGLSMARQLVRLTGQVTA